MSLIAFASCNNIKHFSQAFWNDIQSLKPSYFLWAGDAVYTKGYKLSALESAFDVLLKNSDYQGFANTTYIDGVWDDHDYGVNDGGRFVIDRKQRQELFLSFLQKSNPKIGSWATETDRQGLYHDINIPIGHFKAKFIFLDTRYFRDDHFIPSLGQYKFPLSAIIASAIRASYSILGFGRQHAGSVLGERQWTWLEEILQSSDADLHFIVSSIQILTSNPVIESWGHFPLEKHRLLLLLAKYDPVNLVFLSGDVHMGELSTATFTREDSSIGQWTEVTSSGLTHSCAGGIAGRVLCPMMTWLFSRHRVTSTAHYMARNFGTIEVLEASSNAKQGKDKSYELQVTIRSLEPGQDMLQPVLVSTGRLESREEHKLKSKIKIVDEVDFPLIPLLVQVVIAALVTAMLLLFVVYRRRKMNINVNREKKTL